MSEADLEARCSCGNKAPTYPTYREHFHVQGCELGLYRWTRLLDLAKTEMPPDEYARMKRLIERTFEAGVLQ